MKKMKKIKFNISNIKLNKKFQNKIKIKLKNKLNLNLKNK
jgi:hypothetical protein